VHPRVSLLGVTIDALTLRQTIAEVDRIIAVGRPLQQCSVNASKVVLMHKDPRLLGIIRACGLVNADGQAVVWASRVFGRPLPERVAGVDLFEALLAHAAARGYSVFLLGATRSVVQATAARAGREHPGLRVAGAHDGYWGEDDDEVVREVRASGADILFVAMPSPRKEYWLAERLDDLGVTFAMGVGGSFDVYAGQVDRAPRWMQRLGLEWLFRFAQEPARMWRRYLVGNAEFVLLVARYKLGRP
jgi:N-acetylglucosaminyldiphosphoundecaprenol N-acetyl-beta-D-mannosaminyltransferase